MDNKLQNDKGDGASSPIHCCVCAVTTVWAEPATTELTHT